METYSGVVGILGLIGLAWTGAKMFRAMESGICAIWGCRKRNFVKSKLFGILMVSGLGVLFLVGFLVQFGFMSFWGWLVGKQGALFGTGEFMIKPLIGFAASFAMFLFIYRIVPPVRQAWRKIALGAAVSAAVYLAMMYLIDFYFSSISKVPSLYGELATAIVLIIWLHLTGMLVFFGEEIIYVSQQEA